MRSKDIERLISKIYDSIWKKVFSNKNKKAAISGNETTLHNAVIKLQDNKDFKKFAEKFAKQLARKGLNREKGLWRKYYQAAKEAHFVGLAPNYSEFEKKVMENAIKHNFKMIKSIPEHVLSVYQQQYTSTLLKQVAEGSLGRLTFFRMLKKHGHKNAKLIARTETAKLQTTITQQRSMAIGSKAYIWRASGDIRTRASHKKMNNVIVLWTTVDEQKPFLDKMYGHAGEFPNCRCTPLPILDTTDLKGNTFKVYDYRKQKVVTMNKQKVIKLLENGSFD